MPGTCKYQKSWEKDYPSVSSVRTDLQSAHCGICLKSFKINPHKILKSYCVSSIVLFCLNSHFNCRFLSKLSHSISRWIIIIIQIDQEMPGTCKYQKSWEKDYPWVSSVRTDLQSAYCGICFKSFKISNSGVGQLKSHSKCHKSGKRKETTLNWKSQWTLVSGDSAELGLSKKNSLVLLTKEAILKAEILQALPMVEKTTAFHQLKVTLTDWN